MRTKIILTITCLLLLIILSIIIFNKLKSGNTKTSTTISGELVEFKASDKIFTSFAYVPIIDYKKGYLKRDWLTPGGIKNGEEVPTGYCLREYEVGIGYTNIKELINNYQQIACQNYYEKLPEPIILSTNPVTSRSSGNYARIECDKWDLDQYGKQRSKSYIYGQLKEDGKWENIVENSQKILNSYIRIYCP
ncbi:MAG: hypothetical protein ACMUJM_15570 [bacterium]